MKTAVHGASETGTAFLDETIQLEGKLRFEGRIRMECAFKGHIEGGRELIIGKKARIEGTILARHVYVHGTVQAEEIRAHRLEIFPEGRVEGRVHVERLVVHDGAILQAECVMEEKAAPKLAKVAGTVPR